MNTDFRGEITAFRGQTVRVREAYSLTPKAITVYEGAKPTGTTYGEINVTRTLGGTETLRLKAGETATLFDGKGMEASGPIAFEGKDGFIVIESLTQSTVESPVRMRLVQALVSPEKTDWIIEKAVETGISEIVLVPTARSVTKLTAERATKRLAKCTDIAAGAAEQCGRAVVPSISFMPLVQALEQALLFLFPDFLPDPAVFRRNKEKFPQK